MHSEDETLKHKLRLQAERWRRHRSAGTLGLLVTGGTVGLLFVLPLVGGAYLGRWLDGRESGYSMRWTLNGILLGLGLGIFNVVRFFREHR